MELCQINVLFILDDEIIEGDIIMTDKLRENIREMRLRALNGLAPFDAIRGGVWPGGVVPYRFAGNFRMYN